MSLLLGFPALLAIFIYAMNLENLNNYMNLHSFVLVFGGTLAILLFSSPWASLKQLKSEIFGLFSSKSNFIKHKENLIKISKNRQTLQSTDNELIGYAQDLWQQGISQDLFVVLISQKKADIELRSVDAIQCLKNLAKYPPALGMVGTVIGMVSLFQSMSGNKESIGPSLAVAMTATFMGLALANTLVMPLADRLQLKHINDKNSLSHIYQILLLINQQEPLQLIEDEVYSRVA